MDELVEPQEEYRGWLDTLPPSLENSAPAAPLVAPLTIPGVKANRFHSDKHPEASAERRAAYAEATRIINEAYAVIAKIQASASE